MSTSITPVGDRLIADNAAMRLSAASNVISVLAAGSKALVFVTKSKLVSIFMEFSPNVVVTFGRIEKSKKQDFLSFISFS